MKISISHLLLLCCVGSGVMSCAPEQQTGTFMKGRDLEEQGDYVGALENYQRMENRELGEVSRHNLYVLYGDILKEMEQITAAPDVPQTHYTLGKAYYNKAETLPNALDNQSNFGFDAATYLSQRKQHFQTQAQTAFTTAIQLKPDYVDALLLQALLHEERDESAQAIAIYQNLISRQVSEPDAFSRLGLLLYEQEQFGQGLEFARQAVSRFPEAASSHFVLGDLYSREGDVAEAVNEFQDAVCADPSYHEAYYRIAQVYLSDDNVVDAERVLRTGLIRQPDSLELGMFYQSLRQILDAREQEEADAIFKALEGDEIASTDLGTMQWSEQSLGLQLRYFRLRTKLIERQRPYQLPCDDTKEHPYFQDQITLAQTKITEIEQVITGNTAESNAAK